METKQVFNKTTGELVGELIAVTGGWTKALTPSGDHVSYRNSAVVVRAEGATAEANDNPNEEQEMAKATKATKASKATKTPKAKTPKATKASKAKVAKTPKAKADKTEPRVHRIKGAVVRLEEYTQTQSAAGHTSYDNGDEVATKLRGKDLDLVYEAVAKVLAKLEGEDAGKVEKALKAKYQHLNVGMQRMNLGNRLRGAYREMSAE